MSWTELNWTGLNWTGLKWTGLDWPDLNWIGLNWTELNWTELNWAGLKWTGLNWTALNWSDRSWTELYFTIIAMSHHYNSSLYIFVKVRRFCKWLSVCRQAKEGACSVGPVQYLMTICSAAYSLQLRVFLLVHVFSDLSFTLPFYS